MSIPQILEVEIVGGNIAPRYEPGVVTELSADKAVITEKGMESGLPLIDIQLTGPDGKKYFAVLTGRVVLTLCGAIRGVNLRNHGNEEP